MLLRYCPPLEQRVRDLPERAVADGVHQHFEAVVGSDRGLLKARRHGRRFGGVALLEVGQAGRVGPACRGRSSARVAASSA